MARLILINGAPGSGKSNLARRLAADAQASSPLALVLDIDVVRGLLGRWLETPGDAGILARRHALAMIDIQLQEGRDVIVPQFLGRIDFVLQLDDAAARHGVPFIEIALVSSPDDATRRFIRRSASPENATHRDARDLQRQQPGGDEAVARMYEAMLAVVAQRPATHRVETVDGDEDGTYARLLAAITSGSGRIPA